MPTKKFLKRRKWLNPISSPDTGSIKNEIALEWYIPECGVGKGKPHFSLNADMTIYDCSRSICLDFGLYSNNKRDINARMKKIKMLLSEVQLFHDKLEECLDSINSNAEG